MKSVFQIPAAMFCSASLGLLAAAEVPAPSAEILQSALSALGQHVAGKSKLTGEQIAAETQRFSDHQTALDESETTIRACFDFIQSYDRAKQPLWIGHGELNTKKPQAGDEIHWAVFRVMQGVFDELYTAENVAKYGKFFEGLSFGTADYFPGKVEQKVDPFLIHTVKINGSYPETWGHPVFHEERPARKATGSYLAPGGIATVTVPDAIVGKGYLVRVGAHCWDLSKKPRVKRLYRISAVYPVDSNQVRVANPLGGGIYIEVPLKADAGVLEVSIQGAARSPFHAQLPFHQTTMEEWQQQQRSFKAPWADFQSEKFMMQVPTSWIYKLDDPEALITGWDKSMDVCNELFGRPQHGKESLYNVVDTQLRGRAFHPGYPSGNRGYDPTKDYGGDFTDNHLIAGPRHAISYEFHEMGHGYLFSKYSGDREAAVNLPHVAVMNRMYGMDMDEAFRSSLGDTNEFRTLETTAVTWMMSDSFIEQSGMKPFERKYQLKGHAKYVDVARLFGWDTWSRFWKSTHRDYEDGDPWERDVKDADKFTQRLSEVAGADLRPLMDFWGVPVQNDAASDAALKKAEVKRSAKVYDLLINYKKAIPADNAAFREFARNWWGKEPTADGFTTERNHAARWTSYDEKAAAKAQAVMQGVIDRCFPDGRPQ